MFNKNKKLIISAALTGSIHIPSQTPYLPITPEEIAEEAYKSWKAGASIVHIHARDPETGKPTPDLNIIREIITRIRERCDVIINLTTGGALGMPREDRIAVVSAFKPEIASLNMGSMNFCIYPVLEKVKSFKYKWESKYLKMSKDIVFRNTFTDLEYFCKKMQENETKPELEIYDTGQLYNAAYLLRSGVLKPPLWLQFVMGILGGIGATLDNLLFMKNTAENLFLDFSWSVCASGRNEIPIATTAIIMGGHVRVGLEDNLYLERGILAKSNAELVAKIVRIAGELGRTIASPDETREILGLKGQDRISF